MTFVHIYLSHGCFTELSITNFHLKEMLTCTITVDLCYDHTQVKYGTLLYVVNNSVTVSMLSSEAIIDYIPGACVGVVHGGGGGGKGGGNIS